MMPLRSYKIMCAEAENHNELYYQHTAPVISDCAFDALIEEIKELEKQYPELLGTCVSPTQHVGGSASSGFKTVKHNKPMLSIQNTYDKNEIEAFYNRTGATDFCAEAKLDGVAISLHYYSGQFAQAITRGDGREGDDVTRNVRAIKNFPKVIDIRDDVEIRGEVVMSRKVFNKLNETRVDKFANPRNAAAGTIKLLDPLEVGKRNLDIFAYEITTSSWSQGDILYQLEKLGFKIPLFVLCCSLEALLLACKKFEFEFRQGFDWDIDGTVIKVNNKETQKKLGATSKHPRWMTAYKFKAESATTLLTGITVQVGKTGILTPVAELEPVQLAGSVVRRASLYNFEDLARKDVRVGDIIRVQKAGEIIPQVMGVVTRGCAKKFEEPKKCPACGSNVVRLGDETHLRCVSTKCPAIKKGKLKYFVSRAVMDIKGIGDSLVEQLVNSHLVNEPFDLYRLKLDDLLTLDRIGKKKALKVLAEIEKSKQQSVERVLNGLGIPGVGSTVSELLVKEIGGLEEIFACSRQRLCDIPGIGDVIASSIVDYFEFNSGGDIAYVIDGLGLNISPAKTQSTDELEGKSFVVTGKLSRPRPEIQALIKQSGGKVSSSVSGKTDYLVAGEKAGQKIGKAEDLGVTVISEEMLMGMLDI